MSLLNDFAIHPQLPVDDRLELRRSGGNDGQTDLDVALAPLIAARLLRLVLRAAFVRRSCICSPAERVEATAADEPPEMRVAALAAVCDKNRAVS